MAKYEVLKPVKLAAGSRNWPGDIIEDPDRADLLIERGLIAKVPGSSESTNVGGSEQAPIGAVSPASGLSNQESGTPPYRPSIQEALDAGYSQEAAERLASGQTTSEEEDEPDATDQPSPTDPAAIEPGSLPDAIDLSGVPAVEGDHDGQEGQEDQAV